MVGNEVEPLIWVSCYLRMPGIHTGGGLLFALLLISHMDSFPDSKVHGANMGPIWGRQDPGGPHVGPMNFAIWVNTRNAVRFCRISTAIFYDVIDLRYVTTSSKASEILKKTCLNFSISSVPVDDTALLGAGTSAGTVMTKFRSNDDQFRSHIYTQDRYVKGPSKKEVTPVC